MKQQIALLITLVSLTCSAQWYVNTDNGWEGYDTGGIGQSDLFSGGGSYLYAQGWTPGDVLPLSFIELGGFSGQWYADSNLGDAGGPFGSARAALGALDSQSLNPYPSANPYSSPEPAAGSIAASFLVARFLWLGRRAGSKASQLPMAGLSRSGSRSWASCVSGWSFVRG